VADDLLDEQLHVAELPVTGLVLDAVRVELMLEEKLLEFLAGIDSVLERQDIVNFAMGLKKGHIFIKKFLWFWESGLGEEGGEGDTGGQWLLIVKRAVQS